MEKMLIQAIKMLILGYEKATDNSVSSIMIMDDRGGSGNFQGTVVFDGRSKTYAV
jgi:hypothetical protein